MAMWPVRVESDNGLDLAGCSSSSVLDFDRYEAPALPYDAPSSRRQSVAVSVNGQSRFHILLQQLKDAHEQEVAGSRGRPRGPRSDNEHADSEEASSVGFTLHGKTFGTASRHVRPSFAAGKVKSHRTDESAKDADTSSGKVQPALKPAKRVLLHPDCISPDSDTTILLPQAKPNRSVATGEMAEPRDQHNCPLHAPCDIASPVPRIIQKPESECEVPLPGEAPPPLCVSQPLPGNAAPVNGMTSKAASQVAATGEDGEDDEDIEDEMQDAVSELAHPVLECDLEKTGLPSKLQCKNLVKAALKEDQVCLLSLQAKREVLRYKIEAVWAKAADRQNTLLRSRSEAKLGEARKQTKEFDDDEDEDDGSHQNVLRGGKVSRFVVISPNSGQRLCWDLLTALALLYDVVALPILLGFRPQPDSSLHVIDVIIATTWSLDMIANFLTGYYDMKANQMILVLKSIALRYLKTWFFLDILLIAYDWILMFVVDGSDDSGDNRGAQFGRSLRTLRFVRTIRLLRLLKVKRIMQEIQDRLPSEAASIIFRILKILVCLIFANHLVACMWYFIGTSQGQTGASWVEQNDMESETLAYQYSVSLHWSLSQFTPAGMEIYPAPGSLEERVFSIVVILVAMVGFSSFVSILTASIAELRKLASDEARHFWMLRRFLKDWSVSNGLSFRIQRFLEHAYAQSRRRLQFKDVHLLKLLSEPMHHELMHDALSVHLRVHPVFNLCRESVSVFAGSLASVSVADSDSVFTAGQSGLKMYFVCKGRLMYILGEFDTDHPEARRWSDMDRDIMDKVNVGEYISEAALWTNWSHLGDLEAIDFSTLVVITADAFQKCVSLNTPLFLTLKNYAEAFVNALNTIAATDLTDLLHQVVTPSEILTEASLLDGSTTGKTFSFVPPEQMQSRSRTWAGYIAKSSIGKRLVRNRQSTAVLNICVP